MVLPESLQTKGYTEWNSMVKGLMEVWSVAELLGLEKHLECCLKEDHDGGLTELLSALGSDRVTLVSALRLGLEKAVRESPLPAWLDLEARPASCDIESQQTNERRPASAKVIAFSASDDEGSARDGASALCCAYRDRART